jgi:hypothetical protein
MIDSLNGLPNMITAVGGLGTAAFGLVDASKAFGGSVNHFGFEGIRAAVTKLTPAATTKGTAVAALSQPKILETLQANWFNGTDLASQKAIAKSLIKLNLNPDNAATLAGDVGVDPTTLATIATSIATAKALTPAQSDFFGRFDLIVTALLDEAYQRADEIFKNRTRAVAMGTAILLAIVGAFMLQGSNISGQDIAEAFLIGLLATPLAPIAKDLSTALATAVNALQAAKK